jgi:hypothetical protein
MFQSKYQQIAGVDEDTNSAPAINDDQRKEEENAFYGS